MSSKEKTLLFVLASVNFTHIMDFMIMMPMGPQLMELFHITPAQFGFAVSAYGFMAGITGFASAFFVDRFDRKKVLLFAYVGFVAGTFACALAPSYWLLVAARVLAGFFGGMIAAQVLSIVSDVVPYERRATAMSYITMAFALASVAGVPGGLYLASHFSWHAPFWVIGGTGVVVAGMIALLVPPVTKHLENQNPDRNPLRLLANIWRNPDQMRALTLSIVLMMGHFSIIPYITPSLVSNAGFSQDHIFLIYLVGGALTIVSAPLVGKLADRKGKYPVFVIFAILSTIPVWLITNMYQVPLWVILVVAGLFFIFVNGRMIPMQAIVSSVVTPQQRGGFMAINSSMQQIASALAANIGGMIVFQVPGGRLENYPMVGYFAIVLILSCVWLARGIRAVS